jgi:iron complex outermembrane receptor protein
VSKEEAVVMNPFEVQSDNAGYMISNLASASHMATPIDDIPQDISIITSSLMKDIGAYDMRASFEYTPGVTMRLNYNDAATVYGFTVGTTYINGISGTGGNVIANGSYTMDNAFVDRIEVIKGPAAAIGGTAASNAYVNVVTKQPVEKDFSNFEVTLGDPQYMRFVADMGGTIYKDANQEVFYRLVATRTYGDGYRQNALYDISGIMPAVTWKIGDATSLTVSSIMMKSITPNDYMGVYYPGNFQLLPGTPTPPWDYTHPFYVDPSFDQNDPGMGARQNVIDTYVDFVHVFNEHVSIHNVMNIQEILIEEDRNNNSGSAATVTGNSAITAGPGDDYQTVLYIDPSTGYLMLSDARAYYATNYNIFNDQFDVNLDFKVGDLLHSRTDLGTVWGRESTWGVLSAVTAFRQPFQLAPYAPNYLPASAPPGGANGTTVYGWGRAFYGNEQLYLFKDKLILAYGARWDLGYDSTSISYGSSATPATVGPYGAIIPAEPATPYNHTYAPGHASTFDQMGGVTLRPLPWVSLFASYSTVVQPTISYYEWAATLFPLGSAQNPLSFYTPRSLDRTFGVKTELFNNRLSLTFTHFDMVLENSGVSIVSNQYPGQTQLIIVPGASSIGDELAFSGRITNNLELVGGYTYDSTHTVYGKQAQGVPRHKLQAYLNYTFRDVKNLPWSVRFGVLSESQQWGDSSQGSLTGQDLWAYPAATQFDFGVSHDMGTWNWDLSVRNITNVVFMEFGAALSSSTYGQSRTITFTVDKNF